MANLLEVVSGRLVGLVEQQHVGVTGDDREQVVEVVRDAAGQLAERFHLLRLEQLLLQPPLLVFGDDTIGDVASFRNQQRDMTGSVEDRLEREIDVVQLTVARPGASPRNARPRRAPRRR